MTRYTKETAKEYVVGDKPVNLTGNVRDHSADDVDAYRFDEGDEVYVLLEESHHDKWSVHSVRGEQHPAPPNPSKVSASVRVTLRRLDDGRWVGSDPFCYEFRGRGK